MTADASETVKVPRPVGRPPVTDAPTVRHNVRLPVDIVVRLRELGAGSISRGIIQALRNIGVSRPPNP